MRLKLIFACLFASIVYATSEEESLFELPSDWYNIRTNIDTSFSCVGRAYGYYADVANDCQIYHVCQPRLEDERTVYTHNPFICPLGTVFDQQILTCIHSTTEFNCADSVIHYAATEHYLNSENENTVVNSQPALTNTVVTNPVVVESVVSPVVNTEVSSNSVVEPVVTNNVEPIVENIAPETPITNAVAPPERFENIAPETESRSSIIPDLPKPLSDLTKPLSDSPKPSSDLSKPPKIPDVPSLNLAHSEVSNEVNLSPHELHVPVVASGYLRQTQQSIEIPRKNVEVPKKNVYQVSKNVEVPRKNVKQQVQSVPQVTKNIEVPRKNVQQQVQSVPQVTKNVEVPKKNVQQQQQQVQSVPQVTKNVEMPRKNVQQQQQQIQSVPQVTKNVQQQQQQVQSVPQVTKNIEVPRKNVQQQQVQSVPQVTKNVEVPRKNVQQQQQQIQYVRQVTKNVEVPRKNVHQVTKNIALPIVRPSVRQQQQVQVHEVPRKSVGVLSQSIVKDPLYVPSWRHNYVFIPRPTHIRYPVSWV